MTSHDIVMAKLKDRYGTELDTPQYYHAPEMPFPRRIAHQFALIHQKVEVELAQPAGGTSNQEP